MYDVTIDLDAGLAILIPDKKNSTPTSVVFYRVDFNLPGCMIFYDATDNFLMVLPWASVNIILFEKL